jgi:hypothetical protein
MRPAETEDDQTETGPPVLFDEPERAKAIFGSRAVRI